MTPHLYNVMLEVWANLWLERIYNPITATGFSAMFTFQLDKLRGKHCRHPIAVIGVVNKFGHGQENREQPLWSISSQCNSFSLTLYHKYCVKNGFIFALQFFLLISDSLGGVTYSLLTFLTRKTRHKYAALLISSFIDLTRDVLWKFDISAVFIGLTFLPIWKSLTHVTLNHVAEQKRIILIDKSMKPILSEENRGLPNYS